MRLEQQRGNGAFFLAVRPLTVINKIRIVFYFLMANAPPLGSVKEGCGK
jgi:hypothetical protein